MNVAKLKTEKLFIIAWLDALQGNVRPKSLSLNASQVSFELRHAQQKGTFKLLMSSRPSSELV